MKGLVFLMPSQKQKFSPIGNTLSNVAYAVIHAPCISSHFWWELDEIVFVTFAICRAHACTCSVSTHRKDTCVWCGTGSVYRICPLTSPFVIVSGRSRRDKCKIMKGQQDILKKYLFQYKNPLQSQWAGQCHIKWYDHTIVNLKTTWWQFKMLCLVRIVNRRVFKIYQSSIKTVK